MHHSPMDIYAQYRAIDKSVFGISYQQFKNRYAEFEIIGKRVVKEDDGSKSERVIQTVSGYKNLEEPGKEQGKDSPASSTGKAGVVEPAPEPSS